MKDFQVKDLQRGYYRTIIDDDYYIVPDLPNASGYIRIKCWRWSITNWVDLSSSNPHPQNMSAFGRLAEILGKGSKALSPCTDGEAFNWPVEKPNPVTKGIIKENAYSETCKSCGSQNKKVELFTSTGYYCPNCEM